MPEPPLVIYVDVDDTLVRWIGNKRIPISAAVQHVRELSKKGASLYCWSSGGAEYARSIASELGIADCFIAFLPKPQVILDDQAVGEWKRLLMIHPLQCESESITTYLHKLSASPRPIA